MNKQFFEYIKRAAQEMGGDAHIINMTVGHGTNEETIVVSEPQPAVRPRSSTNKVMSMQQILDKLPKV